MKDDIKRVHILPKDKSDEFNKKIIKAEAMMRDGIKGEYKECEDEMTLGSMDRF